jgi:hypothetical protein
MNGISDTNVEVAHTIISAMKSSMKISLFQWSQVSKNFELKPMIDVLFRKFKISIYIHNLFFSYLDRLVFLFNLIHQLFYEIDL